MVCSLFHFGDNFLWLLFLGMSEVCVVVWKEKLMLGLLKRNMWNYYCCKKWRWNPLMTKLLNRSRMGPLRNMSFGLHLGHQVAYFSHGIHSSSVLLVFIKGQIGLQLRDHLYRIRWFVLLSIFMLLTLFVIIIPCGLKWRIFNALFCALFYCRGFQCHFVLIW